MTPKHFYILLLALVAAYGVNAQSEDPPFENDNNFPAANPAESAGDVYEGSGGGDPVEESQATAGVAETTPAAPIIEAMQPTNAVLQTAVVVDQSCPDPCMCSYEGEDFVVHCSKHDLTNFPSPIDPKTTKLYIQNNKLTVIPKEISSLKNLRELNAEHNEIMDLALGSVSELPELKVLKLAHNRLITYPKDLKNGYKLTKLEELNLGENDMRDELTPEILSIFNALRVITLPSNIDKVNDLSKDLCDSHKGTLNWVCVDSCENQNIECLDTIQVIEEDLLNGTLASQISYYPSDSDPHITEEPSINSGTEKSLQGSHDTESKSDFNLLFSAFFDDPEKKQDNGATEKNQEEKQNTANRNANNPEADVTVGATTAEGKNGGGAGGIDKSVIGIVVAAMVVIVAGITIKKNWTSIKKKFSSSPRPADRAVANGSTLPEEVPLQDKEKSPV